MSPVQSGPPAFGEDGTGGAEDAQGRHPDDQVAATDPLPGHFQHHQGGEDLGDVVAEQGFGQLPEMALLLQQVTHVGVQAKEHGSRQTQQQTQFQGQRVVPVR